jgi:hypothetical protein
MISHVFGRHNALVAINHEDSALEEPPFLDEYTMGFSCFRQPNNLSSVRIGWRTNNPLGQFEGSICVNH